MNTVDKISKDVKIVIDSAKDSATTSIVNAREDLALTEEQLRKIVTIIGLSVDQGYQRSLPFFQNSIKNYL